MHWRVVPLSDRVGFLGVGFDNVGLEDVLSTLRAHVESCEPGYMMSLNLDILNRADQDAGFRRALMGATLVLMDSTPLIKVASRMGIRVREKLSGSDLMPLVCEYASGMGYSCYILGGMPGVPEKAAENLCGRYPELKIAGTLSPEYGFERETETLSAVVKEVREAHPDVLFVCLGDPKGGMFISRNLNELGASFTFDVGAAVDFAAGSVPRAPEWMQRAGLEWFYRFLREPKRMFKRYFVDSWHFLSIWRKYGKASV